MPAQMQLVSDDNRQIRFSNPWKWGPVISIIGLLIWYVVPLKAAQGGRYWFLVGGVVFTVLIGVVTFFLRDELILDLSTRTYIRRRGYWPLLKQQTGDLRDFRALLVGTELRTNPRGGQYPTWVITLQSAGVEPNITLLELRSEAQAYGKVESWSRKLGLPAFENAAGDEKRLDFRPVAQRQTAAPGSVQISRLPQGSRLAFLDTPPSRMILLPPLGLGPGVLILACFPAITLWMGIAGFSEAIHHVPPRNTSFAAGVICFGILILAGLVFAIFGRTMVLEQDDRILIGTRAFGWSYNVRSIAKQAIEEVEVRPTPLSSGAPAFTLSGMRMLHVRTGRPRPELLVRSDDEIVRIGQELSLQDLQWLQHALLSLAQG